MEEKVKEMKAKEGNLVKAVRNLSTKVTSPIKSQAK